MGIPAQLSSVPAQTPYVQYVATSGQTVFDYNFEITQDSDLVVVVNGVTLNTDSGYTTSGVGNSTGGSITFTSGRTAGDIITLYRDIPISRLTQIAQNSGFSSAVFNNEFNNIYLLLQQLSQDIAQCLQVPNTNNPAPTTSLAPANYANKYLSFDANGNPVPAVLTSSGSLTQGIIAGLFQPQTAAENAAGIVPVNYAYPPGHVLRYGTNTIPGTTDMTNAFQAAIAQAFHGGANEVYFPAAQYLVQAGVLTINSTVWFHGDGGGSVLIPKSGSSGNIISLTNSGAPANSKNIFGQLSGCLLENFYIFDTSLRTVTCNGIHIVGCDQLTVRNIYIRALNGAALYIDSAAPVRESWFSDIYCCHCGNTTTGLPQVYISNTASGDSHNELHFSKLHSVYPYERALVITGSVSQAVRFLFFDGFQFEGMALDVNGSNTNPAPYDLVQVQYAQSGIYFQDGTAGNVYGYAAGSTAGYCAFRFGNGGTGATPDINSDIHLDRTYIGDGYGGVGVVINSVRDCYIDNCEWGSNPGGFVVIGDQPHDTLNPVNNSANLRVFMGLGNDLINQAGNAPVKISGDITKLFGRSATETLQMAQFTAANTYAATPGIGQSASTIWTDSSAVPHLTLVNPNAVSGDRIFDWSLTTSGLKLQALSDTFGSPASIITITGGTSGTSLDFSEGAVSYSVAATTASAANVFMDTTTTPANQLKRSTSSIRYKTQVEDLEPSALDRLSALRPVWYRSTAELDRKDWSWYGLIAEEVAEVDPRLVHFDREGRPDGVQYERLAVLLLAKMKQQEIRISELERRVYQSNQ